MDVFLEVLNEDGRFSLQQEIESIPGPVDFQKSVDDENDEKDSREDSQIEEGEASFCLALILGQNVPVLTSLRVTPVEEELFSVAWIPWARIHASSVEKRGTPVRDTISATGPEQAGSSP